MQRVFVGCACLFLVSATALAHGARPHARSVVLDPQDPAFLFVITNVFGHYINAAGMAQPAFICQDVSAPVDDLTGPTGAALVPLDPGRRLVLTSPRGVLLSTDDGCSWQPVADTIAQQRVSALVTDPANPQRLLATTRDGSHTNGVMESLDGGLSWQQTALWGDYFFHDIFIDPVSGRQYATGRRRSDDAFLLFERARGDITWSETMLDALESGIVYNSGTYQIMAVDPAEPLRVFLRARQDDGDRLLRRDGDTLTLIEESRRPTYFEALAWIDGQWVLGRNVLGARVSADGGDTWTTLSDVPPLHCFLNDGTRWLACTGVVGGAAAIVTLDDSTQRWVDVLRYEDVCEPYACSLETRGGRCTNEGWDYQITEFREWGVLQDVCGMWPEPPPPEFDVGPVESVESVETLDEDDMSIATDTPIDTPASPPDLNAADTLAMSPAPGGGCCTQDEGCQINDIHGDTSVPSRWLLMLFILGLLGQGRMTRALR